MKKLFFAAAAALLIGAASCQKSGADADSAIFSKEATDSLLISFGETAGYGLNQQITHAMQNNPSITKEDFLKGMQYAMAADTSEAYSNGMIIGLQIQRKLKEFRDMGLEVDPSVVVNAFKKAVLADSISPLDIQIADGTYRTWNDSLTRAKRAYDLKKIETSEEAVNNAAEGEKFIAAAKASNDSVKVSASGLAYKIANPGEGDRIAKDSRVTLKYTAKTPDGRIVDRVNGNTIMVGSRVEGLQEGLQMLGKGGKATFYVPGKLAYGLEAPARLGVGPNELIIYDVEIDDVIAK